VESLLAVGKAFTMWAMIDLPQRFQPFGADS
jgi:hypothetical protein